jgi:hypothetical protein
MKEITIRPPHTFFNGKALVVSTSGFYLLTTIFSLTSRSMFYCRYFVLNLTLTQCLLQAHIVRFSDGELVSFSCWVPFKYFIIVGNF